MARPRRRIHEKPSPKRPFRGPTPERVYQTVDVGTGTADYILRQAQKFPKRRYAAVDPRYKLPTGQADLAKPHVNRIVRVSLQIEGARVVLHAGKLGSFIDRMKQGGYKARHFNIDMPFLHFNFAKLFREAPAVLLPNGRVFLSTEHKKILLKVAAIAKLYGFRVSMLPTLKEKDKARLKTPVMEALAPIYRAAFIYAPRKFEAAARKRKAGPIPKITL